jgi:hypothetical protein
VRQLADGNVTTVLCLCDLIAPRFLGNIATQQSYFPEWLSTGYLLQDTDLAGRLYDSAQWSHAFGISHLPTNINTGGGNSPDSFVVKAYKEIEPDGEPPPGAAITFVNLLIAFSGLENAGPDLDPATFQAGMFDIHLVARSPSEVTYSYGPDDYGGVDDAQEIWWDPEAVSPGDGEKGHWQSVDAGYRYLPGEWPLSPTAAFRPECLPAGSCGAPR